MFHYHTSVGLPCKKKLLLLLLSSFYLDFGRVCASSSKCSGPSSVSSSTLSYIYRHKHSCICLPPTSSTYLGQHGESTDGRHLVYLIFLGFKKKGKTNGETRLGCALYTAIQDPLSAQQGRGRSSGIADVIPYNIRPYTTISCQSTKKRPS